MRHSHLFAVYVVWGFSNCSCMMLSFCATCHYNRRISWAGGFKLRLLNNLPALLTLCSLWAMSLCIVCHSYGECLRNTLVAFFAVFAFLFILFLPLLVFHIIESVCFISCYVVAARNDMSEMNGSHVIGDSKMDESADKGTKRP